MQLSVILVFIVLLAGTAALLGTHARRHAQRLTVGPSASPSRSSIASGAVLRGIQWVTATVLGLPSVLLLVLTMTSLDG